MVDRSQSVLHKVREGSIIITDTIKKGVHNWDGFVHSVHTTKCYDIEDVDTFYKVCEA